MCHIPLYHTIYLQSTAIPHHSVFVLWNYCTRCSHSFIMGSFLELFTLLKDIHPLIQTTLWMYLSCILVFIINFFNLHSSDSSLNLLARLWTTNWVFSLTGSSLCLLSLHLVRTSNSHRLWALPRLRRSVLKMPFFCLVMLDALALGLLLTMSELLSLVFATMIQWYHYVHTLTMGYTFPLFIHFVIMNMKRN